MHPDVELTMKLSSQDLKNIEVLTLQHYNERAEEFSRGTRDHAVSQNIAALLQYIEGKLPSTILDFGCGPGRDLKAFAELGHIAVGLEGSRRLAAMARASSGYEVWEQDFLKLDLPDNREAGLAVVEVVGESWQEHAGRGVARVKASRRFHHLVSKCPTRFLTASMASSSSE